MKYLIILSLFIVSFVNAQVPQAINYQGILRNASGQAVSMKTINVQVSITSDKTFSISKLLYSERFTVITNEFGTYTISIGYGKPVSGTFSGIDWSTGKQWIFVEVDENLNNVYEFVGSMQFSSVPYALYANSAKIADSVRNGVGIQGPKGAPGDAGTNGTNGATWYTGTLVPASTTGVLNDLYLNTTTGDYYKKTGANIWTMQANLTGPQGPQGLTGAVGPQGPTGAAGAAGTSGANGISGVNGATWYTGSGTASSTTGVVNDLYLNIATGDYYKKTGASTWTFLANISTGIPGPQGPQGIQGPAGATGATGPQGPVGPTGAQGLQGVAGATGATGPQGLTGATGAQGPQGMQGATGATGAAGTNGTNGTNGATWYTGSGTATTTTGVVNDLYLNTTTGDYYKKTGASTWTLQANLTGPQGATGLTGATGAQGPQGLQGVAGPTGATGATGAAGSNATITMGTIAATSNVNGGTITSGVLTLTPADATNGGVLTNGVQSITGTKTFVNDLKVNEITVGEGGGSRYYNVAVGYNALNANTDIMNTAVGYQSLSGNTTGQNNSAIGAGVLSQNNGSNNTGLGYRVMINNSTGSTNTAIGSNALTTITTGNGNTAIGYGANVGSATLSNTTAIGNGAIVNASNTIQLGNTSVTNIKTSGTITAGAITYPNVDGTVGQVLSTTGSGTLTWTNNSSSNSFIAPSYQNKYTSSNSYTIPNGVHTILLEFNGTIGGSGATLQVRNQYYSGCATAYSTAPGASGGRANKISAVVIVNPGDIINFNIGSNGTTPNSELTPCYASASYSNNYNASAGTAGGNSEFYINNNLLISISGGGAGDGAYNLYGQTQARTPAASTINGLSTYSSNFDNYSVIIISDSVSSETTPYVKIKH